MKREPLDSSNLHSAGYDEQSKTLEIRFHSGKVYRYHQVPKSVFEDLLAAPSQGRYFISNIKEVYTWERVS